MKEFFVSYQFVLIILGIFFIFITRKSWNNIIKKISLENIVNMYFKWKNKNKKQTNLLSKEDEPKFRKLFFDSKVKSFDEFLLSLSSYVQTSEQTKVQIKEIENRNEELVNSLRFYMFSYLNLFLLNHTKEALVWFYNNPNITKEIFLNNIFLNSILNLRSQKEIIFNIFLQHYLITKNQQDLYFVTDLGIDFLKFIGSIR